MSNSWKDSLRTKASRVLGVDSSTNSLAWALYFNRKPTRWDEVQLEGGMDARLGEALTKFNEILDEQQPDFVAIEQAVFINNKAVFGKLSRVVGVLIACCTSRGIPVAEVSPMNWQYAIGNSSFTKQQRTALKRKHKGKSNSWISAEIRKQRKQYTIDYFRKKYGIESKTDNLADALGVADYAYRKLTKRR